MNKEFAQYLTVLISNDIDKKLPEGDMGLSSYECEKIENALVSDKFDDVEKYVNSKTRRHPAKVKNMSKIIFDPGTRTFSVANGNVKGKLNAVYVNGQQVNVDGYGQFRTDGIKSISGKGKIDFNSMKCQKADFRGKTHFLGIECTKFEASGAINCSQIRASKVRLGCSGEIGSIVTSSASISNKPYSSSLPVIKGIASFMNNALGASGTLHIKSLTCNSASLDGDITIDVLACKGKCTISGDSVKILRRVQ